jgi:hypothetical protein
MKLAYTIAALAFAVGSVGMTGVANAQSAPQGRYCSTDPFFGSNDCGYNSWSQCVQFAQPNGGFCDINSHWMRMRRPEMPY